MPRIVQIAAGGFSLFALTDDGRMWIRAIHPKQAAYEKAVRTGGSAKPIDAPREEFCWHEMVLEFVESEKI